MMVPERFKSRVVLAKQTSSDCALNCINSTKFMASKLFDCNIFYYEPQSKMCVLYEYDFDTMKK